jgi:hypothetical protein
MSLPPRSLRWRDFVAVLGVVLSVAAAAALLSGLLFAVQARHLLAVHFASIPDTPAQAFAIWIHNCRSILGVAVFAVARPASQRLLPDGTPAFERVIMRVCDAIVGLWAIGYAAGAGLLLGAYGGRQLRAFLPEGPVEVTAWVLLVVLYLDLRRNRLTPTQAALRIAAIVATLAVAAVLELRAGM